MSPSALNKKLIREILVCERKKWKILIIFLLNKNISWLDMNEATIVEIIVFTESPAETWETGTIFHRDRHFRQRQLPPFTSRVEISGHEVKKNNI